MTAPQREPAAAPSESSANCIEITTLAKSGSTKATKPVAVVAHRVPTGFDPTPPELETLHQRPSWCNLRGAVDRSACIEITIAEARELAGCVPHKARSRARCGIAARIAARARAGERRGDRGRFAPARDGLTPQERRDLRREMAFDPDNPDVKSLPMERPARNGLGRLAAGILTITAKQLHDLHQSRMPRLLAGDYRTARAGAMRDRFARPGRSSGATYRCRVWRGRRIAGTDRLSLDHNPNKGATRTKIIGLPGDWRQMVLVEKWQPRTRIRPMYWFICPCQALPNHPAPFSTRRPGRENPKSGRCPQRCRKLLMVQCTKEERRDANTAALWLTSMPEQAWRLPRVRQAAHALMQRYGLIADPRLLLCPRCVGVRYGNHPETARRTWRRMRGLADWSTPSPWPEAETPDAGSRRRSLRRRIHEIHSLGEQREVHLGHDQVARWALVGDVDVGDDIDVGRVAARDGFKTHLGSRDVPIAIPVGQIEAAEQGLHLAAPAGPAASAGRGTREPNSRSQRQLVRADERVAIAESAFNDLHVQDLLTSARAR